MKIIYTTSALGDYATIHYSVTVRCEDDGAHFPYYSFTGWFLLKGDEASKTKDEIYEMVMGNLKDRIKERYGYTLDELESDPAFKEINVDVSKELYFDRQINLAK